VLDAGSIEAALHTLQSRIDLLQQTLAQQNKLATLGMVTAVIAPEFNNILTPMISYTKFAMSEKADDALRQKALSKALTGSERLANISKSLLGFARGDESATASVLTAVRGTIACLARDPAKDGITLTIEVPEDLCAGINAGHLQQVLMNLIVNARSAMLARQTGGSKRITIRGTRRNKTVELSVADTGPGIPKDVLPRIFDPFFSTKKAGEPRVEGAGEAPDGEENMPRGGTGLGLTICQELINAAGGSIYVASEEGVGTTFTIELPTAIPLPKPLAAQS
jgi:signal transduction histidine kinase